MCTHCFEGVKIQATSISDAEYNDNNQNVFDLARPFHYSLAQPLPGFSHLHL